MAAALGKNAPPKGESESWAKLTQEYADNARALEAAWCGRQERIARPRMPPDRDSAATPAKPVTRRT